MNRPHKLPPIAQPREHIMPEKSPESYTLLTYLWVIGLSAAGGAVAWFRKMKTGHVRAFNVIELIGECATSAFAGILTFWLCEMGGFNPLGTAAMVGIAGHMGSRAIANIEVFFESRFPKPPQIVSDNEANNER